MKQEGHTFQNHYCGALCCLLISYRSYAGEFTPTKSHTQTRIWFSNARFYTIEATVEMLLTIRGWHCIKLSPLINEKKISHIMPQGASQCCADVHHECLKVWIACNKRLYVKCPLISIIIIKTRGINSIFKTPCLAKSKN